jgi:hypothetical protein
MTVTNADLLAIIDDAFIWHARLDRGDAAALSDVIIDRLIELFRRDPRFPRLTHTEWTPSSGHARGCRGRDSRTHQRASQLRRSDRVSRRCARRER